MRLSAAIAALVAILAQVGCSDDAAQPSGGGGEGGSGGAGGEGGGLDIPIPEGSGESVEAVIGPDGGEVEVGIAILQIPPGALGEDVTIRVTEVEGPAEVRSASRSRPCTSWSRTGSRSRRRSC